MTRPADKVARFSAELFEAAALEGARQHRSARQQLEHWASVGRSVTSVASASRTRVELAMTGRLPWSDLTAPERITADAEISAAIDHRLRTTHVGRELASEGVTTVALDDAGRLVEHRTDGTTAYL